VANVALTKHSKGNCRGQQAGETVAPWVAWAAAADWAVPGEAVAVGHQWGQWQQQRQQVWQWQQKQWGHILQEQTPTGVDTNRGHSLRSL